ncbi:MAG: YlxR family protein [Deltaproteobacteria bacterium]|nr:YlxR family protein [Deltaproteobacteria bacterium]
MPRRTCLGCREVKDKSALVRLASRDGALTVDKRSELPGRGAYVCRNEACLKEAYRKKDAFGRALRSRLIIPEEKEMLREFPTGS